MKTPSLQHATIFTLCGMLMIPLATRAQQGEPRHPHYELIDLGTFGGITSYINPVGNGGPYMNRKGVVVGSSMTSIPIPANQNGYPCPSPPNDVFHAMEWSDGGVTDLGSLGGARNCGNTLATNDDGESVGTSENGRLDPATGVMQIRAVLWKDGQVKNLGTFGGNHSFASSINSGGQIVGFALDAIPDPFSLFDFGIGGFTSGTQTRAFLWENGRMRDLDTLGGSDAWAIFVNERGQVAGYSYTDSSPNPTTGVPTADPFVWSKEGMIDLGSLGGTFGFPVGLNNRGQVIGVSNLTGDQINHPFLWDGQKLIDLNTETIGGNPVSANAINDAGEILGKECFADGACSAYVRRDGVAINLGTLPGDCVSEAFVVNARGQIAGGSFNCNSAMGRAVLWEDGQIFDLNKLIPSGSNLLLVESNAINDHGEIAGNGFPPGCTDFSCTHAYILIPCDRDHSEPEGCEGEATLASVQSSAVPVDQNSVTTTQSPTSGEIAARIRARFGRNRGLGAWPRK